MNDSTREELRRAYQLIKTGDKAAALAILKPICRADPRNLDAWWMAAYALDDPAQKMAALKRVLALNPQHQAALQLMERLEMQQLGDPFTPPLPMNEAGRGVGTARSEGQGGGQPLASRASIPTPAAARRSTLPLALVGILILVGSAAVIFAVLMFSRNQSASTPTEIALPASTPGILTPAPTAIAQVQPSLTASPLPTRTPLPPTWTPSATWTPPPIRPTNTSWVQVTVGAINTQAASQPIAEEFYFYDEPRFSTVEPAQFGVTYWDGDGDGTTMEAYHLPDGRYIRYFDFPVTVYIVGGSNETLWAGAAQNAINQINRVVPIELTDDPRDPHIFVQIMPRAEYNLNAGCPVPDQTVGCAGFRDVSFGYDDRIIVRSEVLIAEDVTYAYGVLLHELLHALGVAAHSPYPEDVMYAEENNVAVLSERDLNTLERLYANPVTGE